jgi:hypothetical protein
MMEQTVLSKAELARKLNVSRARISQLCHEGLPVLASGKVELQAALNWISTHVDRSRDVGRTHRTAPAPQMGIDSAPMQPDAGRALLIARAKKALADAKRAERVERQQAGELFEVTKVVEYATELSHLVRDHALAQADRLAGLVVTVTVPAEAYLIIRRDNEAMLVKLSKALASLPQ